MANGINRYTTRNRYNQFQPLSFEDFATVPMAYQQAEDQTYESLSGLQTYIDTLPEFRGRASELQQDINQGINTLTDKLAEGYNPSMSRQLINLKRKQQDLLSPGGEGYALEQSKKNYLENVKEIRERYKDAPYIAKYLENQMAQNLRTQGWQYDSTTGVGTSPELPSGMVPYISPEDQSKWLDRTLGNVKETLLSAGVEGNLVSQVQSLDDINRLYAADQISGVTRERVFNTLVNALTPEMIGSAQLASSAMGLDVDESQFLTKDTEGNIIPNPNTTYGRLITSGLASTPYTDLDRKYFQTRTPEWLYNQTNAPQAPSYEEEDVEYINREQSGLASDLEKIGTPKAKPPYLSPKERRDANISDEMWEKANRGKEYSFNDLDKESQEQYNFIAESLLKTGEYGFDKYSPEMQEVVNNYLKSNVNRPRTNLINTSDVYTTYGQNSIGTHKSDSKKQGEAIWNNRFNRNYFNPDEPNEGIKTYKEAVDEGWIEEGDNMNQSQFTTAGYYDARNYLPEQLESDAFVSPYVVNTNKGNRLYVTRSESERNTPTYKTDVKFNQFWMNLDKYPNIPITFDKFKDGSSIEILNQGNDNYLIQTLDKNGNYISEPQIIEGDNNLRRLF